MSAMKRVVLVSTIASLAIGGTWLCARHGAADPFHPPIATQTPFAGCDDGEFCIYEHASGKGRFASLARGTDNLADHKVFGGVLNDKVSAVWNRDHDPWCLYEHADTRSDRGHTLIIPAGYKGSIARVRMRDGFRWNDKASAVRKAHFVDPPLNPAAAHFEC